MNIHYEPRLRRDKGSALVIVTILVGVAAVAVLAVGMRAVTQHQQVNNIQSHEECFMGLNAAYIASARDIENGGNGAIGIPSDMQTLVDGNVVLPEFDDVAYLFNYEDQEYKYSTLVQDLVFPDLEYYAFSQQWDSDGIDNNGDGSIDGREEEGYFSIFTAARNNNLERFTETITRRIDVNIWNNAIFGGPGLVDGSVHGDASIHGSVHILGDAILEGNVAIGGTETSISNTIQGMPRAMIEDRIYISSVDDPDIVGFSPRLWGDETIPSLDTMFQVKNGYVALSGDGALGSPDILGNEAKETLDAVFVTDGWIGTNVSDDGYRGVPSTVYADNGNKSLYNLGDKVAFPLLDGTPEEQATNTTHNEIFAAMCGQPYDGNLVISTDTDFYYNATQPLSTEPTDIMNEDDFIWFDAEKNQLLLNGQVMVNGSFSIVPGSEANPLVPNDVVYYGAGENSPIAGGGGKVAILAKGDVNIGTNLLTGEVVVDSASIDIEFVIDGDRVRPLEDYRAEVTVLGVAIQSGSTHLPVTARVNVGGTWNEPWGSYSDPATANLNDGEQHPWEVPGVHPANTEIGIQGKSWWVRSYYSRRSRQYYYSYSTLMSADSWSGSQQIKVLRNGDPVPNIEGFMDQDSITEYVVNYTDTSTNTISLLDNQIIYLFELGTTNLSSSAADFQDLVVLVSLYNSDAPATGGETTPATAIITPLKFPENVLGIMAANDINVSGDAKEIMGAFYAQSDVNISNDATVVGAMVANHFDMGDANPRICQALTLEGSMPPGMIGTGNILSVEQMSWREIAR